MKRTINVIVYIFLSIILIILLTAGVGWFLFNRDIDIEKEILFNTRKDTTEHITEKDLEMLPDLMKMYLIQANVIGKSKYCNVVFQQKGRIRSDTNQKWLPFSAEQYMSSANSGFIWKARALPMLIRDKYGQGRGEVKVTFMGLKKVAISTGDAVDQSSLGRYFGELIWFPIGFLDPEILWQEQDEQSVLATITKDDLSVDATFYFNSEGMISRYETQRYRDETLQNFIGTVGEYADYDGLLIPTSMTAIWDLPEGEFAYFEADVLEYEMLK